ncbi:MAG: hypothetical protein HY064_15710 [Bacteroidetes bacterium]|nr:hypothetical protein [Bacteroidota bacterium]
MFRKYKFNFPLFAILFICFASLTALTFYASVAADEGTLGDGRISKLLAGLFSVFRFPFQTFLGTLSKAHPVLYFPFLLLNVLFYSFILERAVAFIRKEIS